MQFESILSRHRNIALQLSGGRDSLACLYLLRPYWDRITVYWCSTGDTFPETREVIDRVKDEVPHFVEIKGSQPKIVSLFGLPSDIVPASHTIVGLFGSGKSGPLIQDRYSCCGRVFMQPMHDRMIADGVTLIIRGQRADDALKAPITSGHIEDGIEYLFPIEDWNSRQVMEFLRENDAPIPRFYQTMNHAPDCMTCSAYWETGTAKYLKQHHPQAHAEVQRRLEIIKEAVSESIAAFNQEVNV